MAKMRFLLPAIFLFIFLPSVLLARNSSDIVFDSFEETAGTGLTIYTNPAGADVIIDGMEMGRTPVSFNHLTQGIFHIRLKKEGYKDRVFTVTLFNTSRLVVSIVMEEERGFARISIQRTPESPQRLPLNPKLFLNTFTEEAAVTSIDGKTLLDLPAGFNTLIARSFGWVDESISILVKENSTTEAEIIMRPAQFNIINTSHTRRKFNPMNSSNLGVTEIRFDVTSPGSGSISILDDNGTVVFKRSLRNFDTWNQYVTWNGRDSLGNMLPEGKYTIVLEASGLQEFSLEPVNIVSIKLETEINYSANIFPLSLESGISGLTFSPMPQVLPANSFQIDASFNFGSYNVPDNTQNTCLALPFVIDVRGAPINRMELAASLNINSYFLSKVQKSTVGWGITGSVKYKVVDNNPFSFAIGASYAWAKEYGELPLSMGKGLGLYTPLSLKLTDFLIIFSPAFLWSQNFVPSLHFSAGALYLSNSINAGISVRCDLNLTDNTPLKILAGAEVNLFPPPSNFVFSFMAGMWTQKQLLGWYGGLKVGIIN